MCKNRYTANSRFNNFVLINEVEPKIGKTGVKYKQWLCLCDCGTMFNTTIKQISKGRKSCGCLSISNRFKNVSDEEFFKTVKLNHYKNSAKRRNLQFNLTNDYFFKLITSNCQYCGSPPSLENTNKNHKLLLNGIDRIDSDLGYVDGNVKSCCFICNRAKGNLSIIDFRKWINNIIKFTIKNENKTN